MGISSSGDQEPLRGISLPCLPVPPWCRWDLTFIALLGTQFCLVQNASSKEKGAGPKRAVLGESRRLLGPGSHRRDRPGLHGRAQLHQPGLQPPELTVTLLSVTQDPETSCSLFISLAAWHCHRLLSPSLSPEADDPFWISAG